LGRMLLRVLDAAGDVSVAAAARSGHDSGGIPYHRFDVRRDDLGRLLDTSRYEWIVNAIGLIKPLIDENEPASVEEAIAINALFPYQLAAETAARGQRVIQIATDGVFSGSNGPYDEAAAH